MQPTLSPTLPIDRILPELRRWLAEGGHAVVTAEPGAGKTTRVPLALLDAPWLQGRRILMLEPRRLAARSAAHYMARLLGESVGQTVGYRIRLDTRVGPDTRVEVVTEGILTRLLQRDPALTGYGVVLFDEFHERSLHADLGLALCLDTCALLRPDLRLVVMSATLDCAAVAALLGKAPILACEGREFPVETRYLERPSATPLAQTVAETVKRLLAQEPGSLLVFLPGAGEIRQVERRLRQAGLGPDVLLATLYGDLPQEAQDQAIAPPPVGRRKVVLATSLAETSLTIEGIRIVVDGGLMRVPRLDPRTGLSRLDTITVTRDAADQRRGRAGRLEPGLCLRLWTSAADRTLLPRRPPEILEADLCPLALELAQWGVADPRTLAWLDPPPAGAFASARELLRRLGALDEQGRIATHGRTMADLAMHPRLAHMVLKAIPLGLGGLACDVAALLTERDVLQAGPGGRTADLRARLMCSTGMTHGVREPGWIGPWSGAFVRWDSSGNGNWACRPTRERWSLSGSCSPSRIRTGLRNVSRTAMAATGWRMAGAPRSPSRSPCRQKTISSSRIWTEAGPGPVSSSPPRFGATRSTPTAPIRSERSKRSSGMRRRGRCERGGSGAWGS